MEYVHHKDVAVAMCIAAGTYREEAISKILLLGGAPTCHISHYDCVSTGFTALGLSLKQDVLGDRPYYALDAPQESIK